MPTKRTLLLTILCCTYFTGLQGCAMAAGDLGAMAASAAGVPQMNAFLPDRGAVVAGAAQPIDGIWTVSSIAKKIRIEGGRAYAVDGWLHAFTLKVQPNMVVARNITRTEPGRYSGDDLPLLGKFVYAQQPNGSLAVVVSSMTGPIKFSLIPVSVDDPVRFNADLRKLGHPPVSIPRTSTSYSRPPSSADDEYDSESYEDDDSEFEDEWS